MDPIHLILDTEEPLDSPYYPPIELTRLQLYWPTLPPMNPYPICSSLAPLPKFLVSRTPNDMNEFLITLELRNRHRKVIVIMCSVIGYLLKGRWKHCVGYIKLQVVHK